ncbi:MAG: hypothetical protein JNK67_00255 [Alphaproteobacteria bacterium]|nr:hypothetical protein [Alphaproteobacteria bacterium]
MRIEAEFHSGNIEIVSASAQRHVLRIRKDPVLGSYQWFHFAVHAEAADGAEIVIDNAGAALVPKGWPDYEAFASRDGVAWTRVPTRYVDGQLRILHDRAPGTTRYAYFPPYPPERHAELMRRCAEDARVTLRELHRSAAGDAIELLEFGSDGPEASQVWVIGRQHPGEVQASWWMEGFLGQLLDRASAPSRTVIERCRVHVVPNMNPDGSRLGLHRTNSHGVNLNLAWAAPSPDAAPAVHVVRAAMDASSVDFSLDVHGDEELPYTFIANVDHVVPIPPEIDAVRAIFKDGMQREDPDSRPNGGYFRPHTKAEPLSFCSPRVMKRYGAPALTIELPYKRVQRADGSRVEYGPEGCARNGRAAAIALHGTLDAIAALKRVRARAG